MKCPVCRATYRAGSQQTETEPSMRCRRCGVDLSPLIQIHDQALWHYRQALHWLHHKQYAEAHNQIEQALALQAQNADFYALAGRLWALQGEFGRAIAAWQQACQLDPNHRVAGECLQRITTLRQLILQSNSGAFPLSPLAHDS